MAWNCRQIWAHVYLDLPLLVQLFFFVRPLHGTPISPGTSETSITYTNMINSVLEGYDARLRPHYAGKALRVGVTVDVSSFDHFSDTNMEYNLTFYMHQYWTDYRLQHTSTLNQNLTLHGANVDVIWVPDTYFVNAKRSLFHTVTTENRVVYINTSGGVTYILRVSAALACNMNFDTYPMDVQKCELQVGSHGYSARDLVYYWKDGLDSVEGFSNSYLPYFSIHNRTITETSDEYAYLYFSFELHRKVAYFMIHTFIPPILIVILSWVSFWVDHRSVAARVTLGITTVLSMTNIIMNDPTTTLPKVSYSKAIDVYLIWCFMFVFAAFLECAAVTYNCYYWELRLQIPSGPDGKPLEPPDEPQEMEEAKPNGNASSRHNDARQKSGKTIFRRNLERLSQRRKPAKQYNAVKDTFSRKVLYGHTAPIDRYARVFFPVAFLILNIAYWNLYLR
ncbi:PREDICTED: gamma-aminobutyric acid receptor subunit beta-like [Branchiostoma belcheri]|uniref:Gamma-aminobutyric acid receptor subunit beta-like n=1 Tax=Branchiostoma belcheri TaxID=7741 RepID=A0A6P4YWQ8_BRABE|nr:PREDICTED: gamma-aminobutyric acid receptor subunit beta-like [Branchiostoma belcheri]